MDDMVMEGEESSERSSECGDSEDSLEGNVEEMGMRDDSEKRTDSDEGRSDWESGVEGSSEASGKDSEESEEEESEEFEYAETPAPKRKKAVGENIFINIEAPFPVVSVVTTSTTKNTLKRNSTTETRKTTQTVRMELRNKISTQKSSRATSSNNSKPAKRPCERDEADDKSKGWKWHEYNAQEPKKRRVNSTYPFPLHRSLP